MSELKVHRFITTDELFPEANAGVLYYEKSEADKVIADLEESHKMEVGQLLMEIVELKKNRDTAEKLLNKALDCVSNGKNHMMSLARKKNHADYKRCLAMARWCMARYNEWAAYYPCTTTRKMKFLDKWEKRWRKLAEKFKQNTNRPVGQRKQNGKNRSKRKSPPELRDSLRRGLQRRASQRR